MEAPTWNRKFELCGLAVFYISLDRAWAGDVSGLDCRESHVIGLVSTPLKGAARLIKAESQWGLQAHSSHPFFEGGHT